MPTYRILFNGYAANRAVYRNRELILDTPHNWSRNKPEAEDVMFLVHKKIKEHFARFDILLVEKIS